MFFKKKYILLFFFIIINFNCYSVNNNFILNKIYVNGLINLQDNIIKDKISSYKSGSYITLKDTNDIINNIYNTGFFSNINLYNKGNDLFINVKERPIIVSLSFIGNKIFTKCELKKIFSNIGIYEGGIYNSNLIFLIKRYLLNQYYKRGIYSIKIKENIKKELKNKIKVNIIFNEGILPTIGSINFIGNKDFDNNTLSNIITFKVPSIYNFWGILSPLSIHYSTYMMNKSINNIINFYLNKGYLDFRIISKKVFVSKNNKYLHIIFNIKEGKVYKFGNIYLVNKFILPKLKLDSLINIKKGEIFSKYKLFNNIDNIKNILENQGYAFAIINVIPIVDKKNCIVSFKLFINKGKKIYINKINFLNNKITNDYVFRRELQYYEQSKYNKDAIDNSQIRLEKLPYVSSINMKIDRISTADDLININYNIKEMDANSINGNLGFSDLYGFIIGSRLNMPNLLGTSNILNINMQLSIPYQQLDINYINPFFTINGISQNISAYVNRSNFAKTNAVTAYQLDTIGVKLIYGFPISIFSNILFGLSFMNNIVKKSNIYQSSIVKWFIEQELNKNNFNEFALILGLNYDNLNKSIFYTDGWSFIFNVSFNLPIISNINAYKIEFKGIYSIPIPNTILSAINIKAGIQYGGSIEKTRNFPFYENFYGGGFNSVRGFLQGSLGPHDINLKDHSTYNSIGGNLNLYNNYDILFPLPFIRNSSRIRMGIFFDMGNTYITYNLKGIVADNPKQEIIPSFYNLKYSIGIEFRWASPIGLLSAFITKPFNIKKGDIVQIVQFSLGQNF